MVRDTRFLRTFHTVCVEGTFARAAARLHCTQPAVTYQIRMLERDLGAALFERGGRRALLTPAGRRLLAFAEQFVAEFDRMTAEIASGRPAAPEPLRVAAVSGFGRYVLFPALAPLLRPAEAGAGPEGSPARVELCFRTAVEVFRLVEDGRVDLGVVYAPKVSSHLAFRPLRDEELVLIAAPAVARRALGRRPEQHGGGGAGAAARLATYEALPFVTYLEGDYVFGRWFDACFGAQPRRTTSAHQFDELEEVIAAVALGAGVSVVPLDAARAAAARGEVRVLRPVPGRRCVNRVYAVTRAGAAPRPELSAVFDALA